MRNRQTWRWAILALLSAAFVALIADMGIWEAFLRNLFPPRDREQ